MVIENDSVNRMQFRASRPSGFMIYISDQRQNSCCIQVIHHYLKKLTKTERRIFHSALGTHSSPNNPRPDFLNRPSFFSLANTPSSTPFRKIPDLSVE